MDVVSRFERFYFGDKVLRRLEVNVEDKTVCLELDGALLLEDVESPSIFEPVAQFSPARLLFLNCREVRISDGSYAMNNTVVEFSAAPIGQGKTEFRFALTGGWDNDTFWRELTLVADDFSVSDGTTA